MGKAEDLTDNPLLLKFNSETKLKNKTTIELGNNNSELSVVVAVTGAMHSKHQNRPAKLILELWNEYHNLPLSHRFSPKVVFQSMILNEKLLTKKNTEVDMQEEHIVLLTEQLRDLRWWNKVYRWSLFVVILGLLGCAWYFNYTKS